MAIDVPGWLYVEGPSGPAPVRRPRSVRRTTTIDARWPNGLDQNMVLTGRGRDLYTDADGQPHVLAEAEFTVEVKRDREIVSIRTTPEIPELQRLPGNSAGSGYRRLLSEIAASAADQSAVAPGTLLYFLLDDLPGSSLVSPFAVMRWRPVLNLGVTPVAPAAAGAPASNGDEPIRNSPMTGVCIGFQEGASSNELSRADGSHVRTVTVEEVDQGSDPYAWHDLLDLAEASSRRSRRVDVVPMGEKVEIDAFFQDAVTKEDGTREGVHEYLARAEMTTATGELAELWPSPRVLPWGECPLAVPEAMVVLGTQVGELRNTVLERLRLTKGCTHLNDVIRSLSDAPVLAATVAAQA